MYVLPGGLPPPLAEESTLQLVDTHAHLDDERFASDRDAMMARAAEAGVTRMIVVATTAASSRTCIDLAATSPMLWATIGIHPNNISKEPIDAWDQVAALVGQPKIVALGETGLDRHWQSTEFEVQEDYFARHLALSRKTGLPVVIHCREAEVDVERMLRAEFDNKGPIRGVMHSYCGGAEFAQACLDMGLFLSFAGMLTYKNAQPIRDVAATVPVDRILVETDSPYLAPVPLRGKRNEPAFVAHTTAWLANLRGVTVEVLAEQTTANACRLFGLD